VGQPLRWNEPAPGDAAGIAGLLPPKQLCSHRGVDAVRADQDIAGHDPAVGERDGDAVPVLLEGLDARVQADAGVAQGADQNVEHVGAVSLIVRCAEVVLGPVPERGPEEALAGVPGAVVPPLRVDGDPRQRGRPGARRDEPGANMVGFRLSGPPRRTPG
jgi:hypothetical protein